MHREEITLCNHKLSLFQAEKADCPLIVFHSFSNEGEAVYQELRKQNAPECNFLSIGIHDWQREMSPWPAAALSKDAEDFSGGADVYLENLLSTILPWATERIHGKASFIGIAGYSLAGLFALYAMYKTDVFSRVAGMSGSFWFPGFKEFWSFCNKYGCKGLWEFRLLYHSKCTEYFEREMHLVCQGKSGKSRGIR